MAVRDISLADVLCGLLSEEKLVHYLKDRVKCNDTLSFDEIQFIYDNEDFIKSYIKNSFIIKRIRNLIVYSLDKINGSNNLERLNSFEAKPDFYNNKVFYEYISILQGVNFIDRDDLFSMLSTYFDKSRSLYSKYRIFDIVKDKLSDQEKNYLEELLSRETVISDTACRIVDDAIAWDDDFRLLDDLVYLDNLVSSGLTEYQCSLLIRSLNRVSGALKEKKKIGLSDRVGILLNKISDLESDDIKIKKAIMSSKIDVTNRFSSIKNKKINYKIDKLDNVEDGRVISIDSIDSKDLDGAFSIKKEGDLYIFDVYVTDVCSFLKINRDIAKIAYERGQSHYFRVDGKLYAINMLPSFLANSFLSLRKKTTNVIDFKYTFLDDGSLCDVDVSRRRITVDNKLSIEQADTMLKYPTLFGDVGNDLDTFRKLLFKINKRNPSVGDIVAFPSFLTNSYIAGVNEFGIYCNNGYDSTPYLHAVTPLRNFTSDINLAFFLNQNGIVSFDESDLSYVVDNKRQIEEHLSYKAKVSRYIEKNPRMVKKYYK